MSPEKRYRNPFPTTDIIIEYETAEKSGIVVIERKNPPIGLAIPGGFAEWGLTYEENAVKEAKEETSLDVSLYNPGRPWVYSSPTRDPRGHMIANVFIAKGTGELRAGDDAKKARVVSLDELVSLVKSNSFVFDHTEILTDYLRFKGYAV